MKPGKSMVCAPARLLAFMLLFPIAALAAGGSETNRHWSLQPLGAPVAPATSAISPIDAYITARLTTNALGLSPEADRPMLIRRLGFDLIGLPPSPREIDDFVADPSPKAYERLVGGLLASPHYG